MKFDFIDSQSDEEEKGAKVAAESEEEGDEIKQGEEGNLVKIVLANLMQKYGGNIKVMLQAKELVKKSNHVDQQSVQTLKQLYKSLKRNPSELLKLAQSQSTLDFEKYAKYIQELPAESSQVSAEEFAAQRHALVVFLKAKLLAKGDQKDLLLSQFCATDEEKLQVIWKDSNLAGFLKVIKDKHSLGYFVTEIKVSGGSGQLSLAQLKLLETLSTKAIPNSAPLALHKITTNAEFLIKCYVYAKSLILTSMISKGKASIAMAYLKKTIMQQSLNFDLQGRLLVKVAKITTCKEMGELLKVIKQTALQSLPVKVFDQLQATLSSDITHAKLTSGKGKVNDDLQTLVQLKIEVYETQLVSSGHDKSEDAWIEYLTFLHAEYRYVDAKAVKQRAF